MHSPGRTWCWACSASSWSIYSTFLTRSGVLGDTSVHSFVGTRDVGVLAAHRHVGASSVVGTGDPVHPPVEGDPAAPGEAQLLLTRVRTVPRFVHARASLRSSWSSERLHRSSPNCCMARRVPWISRTMPPRSCRLRIILRTADGCRPASLVDTFGPVGSAVPFGNRSRSGWRCWPLPVLFYLGVREIHSCSSFSSAPRSRLQ